MLKIVKNINYKLIKYVEKNNYFDKIKGERAISQLLF
ncbi:unknown protein [Simkania negevensis Z]|uniref:Uncharacterized protein n=1 Tax=Simkania negevensis (strain ATCC VR-1471 / DSM 27360 / Z) TaxID=331113 RepID=F8L6G7_SIMNZ|nr:unknown protein [Simkania negevensis Z]